MLFSEIYSSYFNVVAAVLTEAVTGTLTEERLTELVREKAFSESVLSIPAALKSEDWALLTKDRRTPLQYAPKMPLSTLEKQWLKALLNDPRIRLFCPSDKGLEDVEPLYGKDTFVYFDRYDDADPYDSPVYIQNFQTILRALRERRKLRLTFEAAHGRRHKWVCVPYKLEYSAKDDKFRLLTAERNCNTVNVARITSCELLEPYSPKAFHVPEVKKDTLVMELTDERNGLERVMLHFSHFEKETVRLDETHYRLALRYSREDETELLIRILSFGSVIKVLSPEGMVAQLRQRLERQSALLKSEYATV